MPYKDKKKQIANATKWNKEHPERKKELNRNWVKNHPLHISAYYKKYRQTPAGLFIQRIQRKGSEIKKDEFLNWYDEQKKECVYCGITEEQLPQNKDFTLNATSNKLTIDRKDSNGEYTLINIVLSCMRCNMIKSNFFTYNEMQEIGKKFVNQKIV